jgi:DNA gyrase subunit A
MGTKEEDVIAHTFACSSLADLLFFTSKGRVFKTKAYEIPKSQRRQAKGNSIVNFLQLGPEEFVESILAIEKDSKAQFLAMVTRKGVIKRVKIEDFENVRRSGLNAIKIKDDDALEWVRTTSGKDEIMLVTSTGQAIRFKEGGVRAMGRAASGVRGIKLKGDDVIVGMVVIGSDAAKGDDVMIVTQNGYGKKTAIKHYKAQGRGGSGIKTAKITSKNGKIVTARVLSEENEEMIVISKKGQIIRLKTDVVPSQGRATQGVRIMRLKSGDKVASVALV